MNDLQTLMRYKQWANQLLMASLIEMPSEALTASQPIVFGSLIRTLHHTYAMDLVWQAHLQNTAHGFTTRNPEACLNLSELIEAQNRVDQWYVVYADNLSTSSENELISFTYIGGGEGAMTRRDMLLHVVNHGTYHRGNVTGMMYSFDVMPPTTDYSVFLRHLTAASNVIT